MTRNEFIEGYMRRSDLDLTYRTDDGFRIDGYRCYALPCACGEDMCEGWAMVSEEAVETHNLLYAPKQSESD